ncbi:MAG TPA: DUF5752 family protein [Gammaproteobacteria bacterium]|nr:DUF5752 family protein [Gammaproteobacteria bacterium]
MKQRPAQTVASGDGPGEFAVKDCALIAIATGLRAVTLGDLQDHLRVVAPESLYYHVWGGLLQQRFEPREYNNDFAEWARHALHYAPLAERLAVLDPTDYPDLEDLRREVLDRVEESLYESEDLGWMHAIRPFEFIRCQTVVFDTDRRVGHPDEMADVIPALPPGSIFYHFIDARRREPLGVDDFRAWLRGWGPEQQALLDRLAGVDPYEGGLNELRTSLARAFAGEEGA